MTKQLIFFLTGGILALVTAMGIGRFAYTPMLPLMQNAAGFTNTVAGYMASSNYAGYLAGSILLSLISMKKHRRLLLNTSLTLSVLTTVVMGLTNNYSLWFISRFFSGVASALVFVSASSIVMDKLTAAGQTRLSGFFYSGPGLGIFTTGLIIPFLNQLLGWKGAWGGLGILSAVFTFFSWKWLLDEPSAQANQKLKKQSSVPPAKWLPWLVIAYGCEGFGYIVTGTFIVSIADQIRGFEGHPSFVWMIVGLAAAPSCILWSLLGKRWGFVKTFTCAMVIQSLGIIAPVFLFSQAGVIVSAVLFGMTFMGITTLGTTLASQMIPSSGRIIGFLTAVYAAGQMIAPALAGMLSSITHSYNLPLTAAAIIVLFGACLLSTGIQFDKQPAAGQQACDWNNLD